MGAAEEAVDAAAEFIGPYLDRKAKQDADIDIPDTPKEVESDQLVESSLFHLQIINSAEQEKGPDASYDGSLVGIVYGLLDLITSLGILPFLSPGVALSQRPQSVLLPLSIPSSSENPIIFDVVDALVPILAQHGTGIQPLLSQRALPDLLSALAELALSPHAGKENNAKYRPHFEDLLKQTATSRLLPILTTFLQQDLPLWLRPKLAKDLAMIPLRRHGVRHTIEFLSLSYWSKHSQAPQEQAGSSSQIPIPIEAVTQAAKLLASPPSGMTPDEWLRKLAPQIWQLLDAQEGKELSRAAGHIIAGMLSRKATGAPGAIGWELFARPLLRAISPDETVIPTQRQSTLDQVLVKEDELRLALKRISVIIFSHTHPGLIKRLIHPIFLPLWGLLSYSTSKPSINAEWTELPRSILIGYMTVALDARQIDRLATNMFSDGTQTWTFGPGSAGGVELRARKQSGTRGADVTGLFSRIAAMDDQVQLLLGLLIDANIDDEAAATIFSTVAKRWLSTSGNVNPSKPSLTHDADIDPLDVLVDAKLSEALARRFQDKFARSPRHVIALMTELLGDYVAQHKSSVAKTQDASRPSRATLSNLASPQPGGQHSTLDQSDDLASFALSILSTLFTAPDFKAQQHMENTLQSLTASLQYLSMPPQQLPIAPLVSNAASNLLSSLQQDTIDTTAADLQTQNRATLKTTLTELTSQDPPNRTWALSTLRKLIQDPTAFTLVDVPSTTHLLLNVSIADPESYVHLAAIPVLVDLATRAPNPTLRILVDAFVDIEEMSLRSKKEVDIVQALDFRLRVGEVLNNLVLEDAFWEEQKNVEKRHASMKMLVEATLSLASRRGQRHKTLSKRNDLLEMEKKFQEEGERAWNGPIPNLFDPEDRSSNPSDEREREALLKIVQGWQDTGVEEDVRIRASALSILGSFIEKRLELLSQVTVDAALQMVIMILTMETGTDRAILRRAAVLIIMGLLRALDALLEEGKDSAAGLGLRQSEEIEKTVKRVKDEDSDELVRSHAENVVEGLNTLKMKKLYKLRDENIRLGTNMNLEGNLRGLDINLQGRQANRKKGPIVEEIE
ncbi:hypothetical protein BDV96DRAFT_485336 [Lophiotrema nucula]|uniref:RNA polymerase II assembly factor Rtp1 C-terminal domain-containing protein n=1 Tax=Lophiotrema nucula TaxID=690887 RepID=A0A6A5ZLI0_9PLEO|nr:hypothetical protein BDV96DRAFT_485336 [Lophiotrema nucula]